MDFVSTWIGIVHYHATEIGVMMSPFTAIVGLVPGLVLGKSAAAVLILVVGLAGRRGIGDGG